MRRPYVRVKRALDVVFAAVALVLSAPIQLVIAALVRLNLGSPVLFKQERPGRDGKIFTMLKKRIIDTAIQEINEKTDLKVVYDLEIEGRKITAIVFRVSGTAPYEVVQKNNEEILHKLNAMGIKDALAKELLEKHDEDYILANIRVVEEELKNGKEIRNIPAYLMKAFTVDFRHIETEFEKVQKGKKQEKLLEIKQAEEWEVKKSELSKQFEHQKMEAVADVLNKLSYEETAQMKAEFLAELN